MKKIVSLALSVLLSFVCITPVLATGISPRYINTRNASVSLDIDGDQFYCGVVVSALNDGTPIRGTLKLSSGSYSQSWPISGTGDVDITKTVTRSQSGTYVLTFVGTCGSDSINKRTSGSK